MHYTILFLNTPSLHIFKCRNKKTDILYNLHTFIYSRILYPLSSPSAKSNQTIGERQIIIDNKPSLIVSYQKTNYLAVALPLTDKSATDIYQYSLTIFLFFNSLCVLYGGANYHIYFLNTYDSTLAENCTSSSDSVPHTLASLIKRTACPKLDRIKKTS